MTIGIPRALLYYKYGALWEVFFEKLGADVMLSPETNRQILGGGIKASIDESCLPVKIFLGHIAHLIGKCDYILIPRVENLSKSDNDAACVKFFALYDIVNNTFGAELKASETRLLDYNIDLKTGNTEKKAFLGMGKRLGYKHTAITEAYKAARTAQDERNAEKNREAAAAIYSDNLKILVIGHPYNVCDPYIGLPAVKYLNSLGLKTVFAHDFDAESCAGEAYKVSPTLCWAYNKELAGAAWLYKDLADGIIFITAFPCGPDSLVTELMLRKFRGTPKINLVIDELQSESGMATRLESFADMIFSMRNAKFSMLNKRGVISEEYDYQLSASW